MRSSQYVGLVIRASQWAVRGVRGAIPARQWLGMEAACQIGVAESQVRLVKGAGMPRNCCAWFPYRTLLNTW